MASHKGRYEVVKILLAHGADVHAKTAFGSSPLELARQWEHTGDTYEETVSVLEEAWKNEKERQAEPETSGERGSERAERAGPRSRERGRPPDGAVPDPGLIYEFQPTQNLAILTC